MHAASNPVARHRSRSTPYFVPVKSCHLPLTWSRLAHSIVITTYTSGAVASSTTPVSAYGFRRVPVEDVPLAQIARGRDIRIRRDSPKFNSGEVVERAPSRLGESRYRLLTNNREHFCSWALRDECYSKQVEWLRALQRVVWTSVRVPGWLPAGAGSAACAGC
jgi:hypothetical protein